MSTTPLDRWLHAAADDADRRGLAELKPLLETLARSTATLREAERAARDDDARAGTDHAPDGPRG